MPTTVHSDAGAACDPCGVAMQMDCNVLHEGGVSLGEHIIDSAPMIESWSGPVMEGSSVVMPMVDGPSSSDVVPTNPTTAAEPKPVVQAEPKVEPKVEPVTPPVEPPPADNTDLFGEPAAPAEEAKPPMDDLFGEPAASAPKPAEPAEPAAPAAPADPAPAAPAEEAMNDLFGDAPAAPADAAPAAEKEPADDLFGVPADAAPAAAKEPADDLFGVPADAAPAAAPAADDIFGAPPAAEPAVPAAEPAKDAVDDLFGAEPTAPADPFANSRNRIWIDNTGDFSTEGRLIEIGSDFIRLAKANGRTCTVPNSRLCPADVAYITSIQTDRDDIKVAMVSTSR